VIQGLLLDAEYVTLDEKAIIRLWCKGEEVFIAYDKNFKPYFYVFDVDEETIERAVVKTRKGAITPESYERRKVKILGEEKDAFVIYAKHPQHVPKLREIFSEFGEVREAGHTLCISLPHRQRSSMHGWSEDKRKRNWRENKEL
jgi:DNA polymerase I